MVRLRRGFGGGAEGCELLILLLLSVGVSLLAKAACQPTMLYQNAPNLTVGAGLLATGGLPADHFGAECTESNCRSEPARDGGLMGDANLPEYPSHASYNFFRNLRS